MKKEKIENKFNEEGIFSYNDEGFDITINGVTRCIKWSDIEKLSAYKIDLFTFDEIRIEILLENERINISEETMGWHLFIEKFTNALKGVNAHWEDEVTKKPFATDWTIIYEKNDE